MEVKNAVEIVGNKVIAHKVELTEKDLYFLEKVLLDYTIQDQQEYNHKADIIKLIEEMLQDY